MASTTVTCSFCYKGQFNLKKLSDFFQLVSRTISQACLTSSPILITSVLNRDKYVIQYLKISECLALLGSRDKAMDTVDKVLSLHGFSMLMEGDN